MGAGKGLFFGRKIRDCVSKKNSGEMVGGRLWCFGSTSIHGSLHQVLRSTYAQH